MDWLQPLSAQGSLRKTGLRSLAFTGGSQMAKLVLNVAATLVLVRLLLPSDFGLFAMTALVVNFILAFKDLGLTTATIQHTKLTHRQVSTMFWLNQAGGMILAVATLAIAPLLAWFFKEPAILPAVMLLSLGALMGSLSAQHSALLSRNLRFATIGLIEVTALIISMTIAISMAWSDWGWWSLIIQRLAQMSCILIGTWTACSWRPSWVFSWAEAKDQFKFGLQITIGNLSSYATRNVDNMLVGWYWGSVSLGFYAKAYDLLIGPLNQISAPLGQALQPVLGRLRSEPTRYRVVAMHALTGSLLALLPVGLLMFWQPLATTQLLLGDNWLAAAPVLGWFGLGICIQLCGAVLVWLLVTQQRGGDLSRTMVGFSLLNVLGFVVALPFGITAMAATYVLLGLFIRTPWLAWVTTRKGPVNVQTIWRAIKLPTTTFILLSAIYQFTPILLTGQPIWLALGVQLILGYMLMGLLAIPTPFGRYLRGIVFKKA